MRIPGLSFETIESNADAGSIEKGKKYFESDAVKSLRRTADDEIESYVQGGGIVPYHVRIKHSEDGIAEAECTCPYVEGTWCRHIVATLLAVLAGVGEADRSVSQMLDEFDRVELIHMMERLVDANPSIFDMIQDEYLQLKGE